MCELVVLDVGHGNSAVLRDGDAAIVIDAGPGTTLLEYLRQEGIRRIEAVLISHADTDHIRGLGSLLEQTALVVDAVYVNSDAMKGTREWAALVETLDIADRKGLCSFTVQLTEGTSFQLGSAGRVRVLAPRKMLAATGPGARDPQGRRITTNSMSAVVQVHVGETIVLLAGDLDELGLDHALDAGVDLGCDVLVYPHHGGNVTARGGVATNVRFADALIAATAPKTVLFSNGRGRFGNPRAEVVSAVLARGGSGVMCTQMAEQCSQPGFRLGEHLSEVFASGRRLGHCCAGSVVVSERGLAPTFADHAAFVAVEAPTRMCS